MGIFSFITDIFSKPKKGKPKKKAAMKATAKKKVNKKKKAGSKDAGDSIKLSKKKKAPAKKKKNKSSGLLPFSLDAKNAKKRKKSRKISADPIDEQSLGFSISLKSESAQAKKREAMRISVKGLTAYIHQLKKHYPVMDISATGFGFKFEKPRMKGGVKLEVDLHLKKEVKVSNLLCKVMRHDRGSVGCLFLDLDRAQDDVVHEIVLLGQKEQTARRNAMKDLEFKVPN